MGSIPKLTNQQARRFLLLHQQLWPPRRLTGKAGILEFIRRVGCIQYDPLDRVGRNPDLVLQSRINDYRPTMLDELLYEDRALLDGWDKNASIYATEDWPYFRRYRDRQRRRFTRPDRPAVNVLDEVREAMHLQGPLSSSDLDFGARADWAWGPTRLSRAALESMYAWGELIVHHKEGVRKIYDFADNHLPRALLDAPEPNPTDEQYYDWHALRRIGSVGILWAGASDAWLEISGFKGDCRSQTFPRLLDAGVITQIEVEGISRPLYVQSQHLDLVKRAVDRLPSLTEASILAPLDNLLWDRKLIRALFDFEYVWEVYKPAGERRYGYYVLPVLYADRFIARFEPVFDRSTGCLEILDWWWEPTTVVDDGVKRALLAAMQDFAGYLGAHKLKLSAKASDQGIEWLRNWERG